MVPVVFFFILGGAIGALITYLVMRHRAKAFARFDQDQLRRRMAHAWQEGFDAGRRPVPDVSSEPTTARSTWEAPPSAGPPPPAATPRSYPSGPARLQEASRPASARVVVPRPAPRSDDPDAAARRQRRNINITLYVAALLIVAASALFLTSSLPYTARWIGMLTITGVFYLGGLIIHRVSAVLRPAALAFTGTGLALIPLAGIAINELGVQNPAVSWLVTSAVGLVLMVVAAERFDSTVAVYLTMPFVISASLSVGAVLQRGMVWGLLFTIAVCVIMTLLSRNAREAPEKPSRWARYQRAMVHTHRLLVPAILAATVVLGLALPAAEVLALLVASAAYYLTAAIVSTGVLRLRQTYGARALLTVSVIPAGSAFDWAWSVTTALLAVSLLAQSVLVLLLGRLHTQPDHRYTPAGVGVLRDAGACFGGAILVAMIARLGALIGDGTWLVTFMVATLVVIAGAFTLVRAAGGESISYHLGLLGLTVLSTSPVWIDVTATGWLQQFTMAALIVTALGHRYRRRRLSADQAARWDRWWTLQLAAVAGICLLWMIARTAGTEPSHAQIIAGLMVLVWACVCLLGQGNELPGRGAPEAAWGTFGVVSMWMVQVGMVSATGAQHLGRVGDVLLVGVVVVHLGLATVRLRAGNRGSQWALIVVPLVMALSILPYLYRRDLVWTAIMVWAGLAAWLWTLSLISSMGLIHPLRRAGMWAALIVSMITVPHVLDELGAEPTWTRISVVITATVVVLSYRRLSTGLVPEIHRSVAGGVLVALISLLWIVEVSTSQDRLAAAVLAVVIAIYAVVIERRWGSLWCAVLGGTVFVLSLSSLVTLPNGPWGAMVVPVAVMAPALWITTAAVAGLDFQRYRAAEQNQTKRPAGGFGEWILAPVISGIAWLIATIIILDDLRDGDDWGWMILGLVLLPFVLLIYARSRSVSLLVPTAALLSIGSVVATVAWWGSTAHLTGSDWNPGLRFALIQVVCAVALALTSRGLKVPYAWAVPMIGSSCRPRLMFLRSAALGPLIGGAVALWSGTESPATILTGVGLTVGGGWLVSLHVQRRGLSWGADHATGIGRTQQLTVLDSAMVWAILNLSLAVFQLTDPYVDGVLWWILAGASFTLVAWGIKHHLAAPGAAAQRSRTWWHAGMAFFTIIAVVVIVEPSAARQLAVIIGFAAFIAVGLVLRERVSLIWGAVGVGLSILYHLRWLPFLWLGALGLGLIALAIWQLRRLSRQRNSQDEARDTNGTAGMS